MDIKHKIRLALPIVIYGIFYMASFRLLEQIDYDHYFTPYVWIDHEIPFVPWFVFPYLAWFIWVPGILIYLLINDEHEFRKSRSMLIIGMTLFLLFSALFPTKLFLRPYADPNAGISYWLLSRLYSADTATNVFPSIHVYNTCATLYSIYMSDAPLFKSRGFRIFACALSLLICMSTMLIKQHSIVDVAGAIVMFVIVAAIVQEYHKKYDSVLAAGA